MVIRISLKRMLSVERYTIFGGSFKKARTGHDITKGVYTQKTMEELLHEVYKL